MTNVGEVTLLAKKGDGLLFKKYPVPFFTYM